MGEHHDAPSPAGRGESRPCERAVGGELLVSKGWVQATLLVVLFGFFVLGLLAYRTYQAKPPTPDRVVDPRGRVLYTARDVREGQQVFLHNGLMEYGSVFGHGAYLGPDYTADYLRRASDFVGRTHGGSRSDIAARRTVEEFRTNRYDEATGTLTLTAAQAEAHRRLVGHYSRFFSEPTTKHGLREEAITDRARPSPAHGLLRLDGVGGVDRAPRATTTPTRTTGRPSRACENEPTANVIVWSVLSLIALLGGIGILFGVFGRWRFLGWHGREQATLSFRTPGDVALTPAQRATAWFFFVMAALFLIQTFVGAASQHYRAELSDFFGFNLAQVFPYNLMRTWHVQLALFWVATSFVAAGIFLAPMIARREPRHQGKLAFALLGALAVVVFGTLIGSFLGIHGVLEDGASNWFGLQGFEYLDLARLWQVLLSIGLFVWVFMLFRVLRTRLRGEHPANMPWLFFLAALAIPAFYAVGLIARTGDHFTVTEFWRFWVVHLWVEDFLELFTTVMVAYMFVLLGVVRERVALIVIFLDIILYSFGGVIGTMHHLYFSGEPAEHMALGAFFSAAEVIPLTFLTVEAWCVPAARRRPGVAGPHAVPAPLGGDVPRRRRLLELPRRRDLRLPHQPADRLLLRDRHRADRQPRPRGDDGRLRDAGHRPGALLPALPDPRRALAGEVGAHRLLVDEHRPGLDVLRHAAAARHRPALQVRRRGLLGGPRPEVPHRGHQHPDRMAAPARRHRVHRRRRHPGPLHHVPRHPPHRQAGHARRARRHPLHRGLRARGRPRDGRRRGHGGEGHMSPETLLAAGYAGFLLVAAAVLELLSAHTHRRSLRYRTAGFDYDEQHDHWRCPEGEHLWPHEFDHERRLVRYRAKAHICNGCPRKDACTDSDHGREIVRPLDPWPHSEAGRFHRGLSLLLVVLALLVVAVGAARNHEPAEAGAAGRAARRSRS